MKSRAKRSHGTRPPCKERRGNGRLDSGGQIHYRRFFGKTPVVARSGSPPAAGGADNNYALLQAVFRRSSTTQTSNLCTLRGLFTFKERAPVPIDEVEPADSIVKRFVDLGDVLRLHQQGGARDHGDRHEPSRRGIELRRRRRG